MDRSKKTLSHSFYILFKWKKFLFINLFILLLIGLIISFLIPEKFKATSLVMVAPQNPYSMQSLGSLMGDNGTSLGARLLGIQGPGQDLIFGIFNSRSELTNTIYHFNLMKYYEINDGNIDKALKAYKGDINFEPTDNGLIEVSVINKSPDLAARIANYMVNLADSINIELNIKQARNNRLFVEGRYHKNLRDLKAAEDSMYRFQKKYNIVTIPDQLEVTVKAAAELEASLTEKRLLAEIAKKQYGMDSPQYDLAKAQADKILEQVEKLKNSSKLSSESNVMYPFKEMPKMSLEYLRNFREVEIQTKTLEFILPLYEQALVEEKNSEPTLTVLDSAVPPQLKDSPKKSFIVLGFLFIGLFLFIPFIFLVENILNKEDFDNPLEEKSGKYFTKIKKFYRIK
jgi:capsule polysaccharide export protein KpsE/RkpR